MHVLVLACPRVEGQLLLLLTLDPLNVELVQQIYRRFRHLPQSSRRRLRGCWEATAMDREQRFEHEERRADLNRKPLALHGAGDELDNSQLNALLCSLRALAQHHADSREVWRVDGVQHGETLQHDEAEAADLSVLVLRRLHSRLEHVEGGAELLGRLARIQVARVELAQLLLRGLESLQQLRLLARHQALDPLDILEQQHQRLLREGRARFDVCRCDGLGRMSIRGLGLPFWRHSSLAPPELQA
mmetsp:Transcript_31626/g.71137  ORF Transcript_31626/g.71137 Transcript_31626/m.71137 type:complete len:245 (-) Transcript_31626:384-1118(-)